MHAQVCHFAFLTNAVEMAHFVQRGLPFVLYKLYFSDINTGKTVSQVDFSFWHPFKVPAPSQTSIIVDDQICLC